MNNVFIYWWWTTGQLINQCWIRLFFVVHIFFNWHTNTFNLIWFEKSTKSIMNKLDIRMIEAVAVCLKKLYWSYMHCWPENIFSWHVQTDLTDAMSEPKHFHAWSVILTDFRRNTSYVQKLLNTACTNMNFYVCVVWYLFSYSLIITHKCILPCLQNKNKQTTKNV